MNKSTWHLWRLCSGCTAIFILALGLSGNSWAFGIGSASWDNSEHRLTVRGSCDSYRSDVTVTNADTGANVGTDDSCSERRWGVTRSYDNNSSVPCRVKADQTTDSQVLSAEMDVSNAPSDCDDGGTPPPGGGGDFPDQTDFKIMMNYELGMHCTGFEFAYCCVLPVYNSILAQVVKPNQGSPVNGGDFPIVLDGSSEGADGLGREVVLRDHELDAGGNFKKYVLKYWHDAQPRNDGNGKPQTSTLISAVEGNSLMAWNTRFDSAALNPDGTFVTGSYNGADGVVLGNGSFTDPTDNYQNAVWNHLYFYENLEGGNSTGTTADSAKIRLGVAGMIEYLPDCGPALHPMGPTGNGVDGGDCGSGVGNLLTYSGENGTVVFTQMKVLENLPIMLTSPNIWEALGSGRLWVCR